MNRFPPNTSRSAIWGSPARWSWSVLWLLAVVGLGAPGCRRGAAESEATAPAKPVPVRALTVQRKTLTPSLDLVGTLVPVPEHTAVISPRTSGWIERVEVVEGTRVAPGDVLVVFDKQPAKVQLAKAEADVAEKQALLARLKNGYLPQELQMARRDLQRAEQDVEVKQHELDSLLPLWKRGEIPDLQYRKAQAALKAAEAMQGLSQAKLELLEAGTRPEEIAQAEAQLASAQAARDAAQLNLDYCRITSPIGGTVTGLLARKGMFVDQATTLLTVIDLDTLFLEIRIPAKYAANIGTGAAVTVFLPGSSSATLPGGIVRTRPEADRVTGDLIAWAEVADTQHRLRPGMSCRARLWLPPVPDAVAVPSDAVADRSGTPVVTLVRHGKAYETEVRIGLRTENLVEVLQGVSPGDVVVTEGGYGLPDGCPVEITEDSYPSPPGKPSRENR